MLKIATMTTYSHTYMQTTEISDKQEKLLHSLCFKEVLDKKHFLMNASHFPSSIHQVNLHILTMKIHGLSDYFIL